MIQVDYTRYAQFKNATIHIKNNLNPADVVKEVNDNAISLTIHGGKYTLKKLEFEEFALTYTGGTTVVSGRNSNIQKTVNVIHDMLPYMLIGVSIVGLISLFK